MTEAKEVEFDEFGPETVIQTYDQKTGMKGILVIDNTALGPGKGGMRFAERVTVKEVAGLARTMTWKTAIMNIPFGGAKSGIISPGNPHEVDKIPLIKAFARSIKPFLVERYISAPDMNVGEKEIAAFVEAAGNPKAATGKPVELGGLPHELGSTGFGVAKSALVALELMNVDPKEATVAIEGFGNVGTFTARFLAEAGAKIVAVSDSKGCAYLEKGFDVEKLIEVKAKERTVTRYPGVKVLPGNELFWLGVTVLVPGARPDAINDQNKSVVRAKLIVEAANIPVSHSIEQELWDKGIKFVPDFVANAGGVISSWVEHKGGSKEEMFKLVEEKIVEQTRLVLKKALETKQNPRKIAEDIAKERVREAMAKR